MKTIHFTEPADAQTKLDVMVEIGSLTIRPSDKPEIFVEATYRHMDVWVARKGDTVQVVAEQEDDFLQRLSRLFRDDHPKADITIHLPAHCEVQAKTVTGSLDIKGMSAPISARVITGKLVLQDIHGSIYAKTITGKLRYSGELTAENHRFETVTGEIVLALPATANAKLSAQTATGKLRCLLPLANSVEERHFVGGKMQGTLGSGEGRIKAKISTGNLLIKPLKDELVDAPAEKPLLA